MCHREGLYQIDLLNGSKNRVTDREYWAQKKGQAALDKQNAPMIAGGITPRQTKFETNKEKLRQTLRKALATAASFDEFSSLLLREGVTVKESRGRLSYLTPDRTVCSGLWTLSRRWPRARAKAMNDGRRYTI